MNAVSMPKFREDINGLRAWAVVAVILYHFKIPGFTGGFVGVDVFFVISGFLMTKIIVRGLEQDGTNWSLLNFYSARARRTLPALAVTCAVLIFGGWFCLSAFEYRELANRVVLSLGFVSNFKYWHETGYFNAVSHEKWLLHTWSLAVEWQFYLLLPLSLLLAWRVSPSRSTASFALLLLLALSLLASLALTELHSAAAFYLLPSRAWELLVGGVVWLYAAEKTGSSRWRRMLEPVGMALTLFAVGAFDSSNAWPGWRALIPVSGAALVLVAAVQSDSVWTGNAIAQWLGSRSYSLYLWHWPVAVALTFLDLSQDPLAICAALVFTLLLADLSYRLVELPAQKRLQGLGALRALGALTIVAFGISAVAITISLLGGIPQRVSASVQIAAAESENRNPKSTGCSPGIVKDSSVCNYGGANVRAILIGDSHGDAIVSGLAAAHGDPANGVRAWTSHGCPILLGVKLAPMWNSDLGSDCNRFLKWSEQQVQGLPRDIPVVVVFRTTAYAIGMNELSDPRSGKPLIYFAQPQDSATPQFLFAFKKQLVDSVCRLAAHRPVYLVRPIPEMGRDVPHATARALMFGSSRRVSIPIKQYRERHAAVWEAQDEAHNKCGAKLLDPLPYLCWDGACQGVKDNRPLYFDDDHLSEYGNKLLKPMFSEVFR